MREAIGGQASDSTVVIGARGQRSEHDAEHVGAHPECRRSLPRHDSPADLRLEPASQPILLDFQVVARLQIHPEPL